jgi:hypothetical protein
MLILCVPTLPTNTWMGSLRFSLRCFLMAAAAHSSFFLPRVLVTAGLASFLRAVATFLDYDDKSLSSGMARRLWY